MRAGTYFNLYVSPANIESTNYTQTESATYENVFLSRT